MVIQGVGTVAISMESGEVKQLHGVQLVPGLAHNLLSVRQLLTKGYSVVLQENKCIISDDRTGKQVVLMPRSNNNMFLLDLKRVKRLNLAVKGQDTSELWHRRFGHLNYRSLDLLAQIRSVHGLPDVKIGSQCKECAMCKHARSAFPSGSLGEQQHAYNWSIWTSAGR